MRGSSIVQSRRWIAFGIAALACGGRAQLNGTGGSGANPEGTGSVSAGGSTGGHGEGGLSGGATGEPCAVGYARDVEGTCAEIDECATGEADCDANAQCSNIRGSYTCKCLAGYEGDGVVCELSVQTKYVAPIGDPAVAQGGRLALSDDGAIIVFCSNAPELLGGAMDQYLQVFSRDLKSSNNHLLSESSTGVPGDYPSCSPSISGDGRYVAFSSFASNLVDGDESSVEDVFLFDDKASELKRITALGGTEANGNSNFPSLSKDGRYLTFHSYAWNLGPQDSNSVADVYVLDRTLNTIELVSFPTDGMTNVYDSVGPTISSDGQFVSFQSLSRHFVPSDTNARQDIFVHDRNAGSTIRASVDSAGKQAETPVANEFYDLSAGANISSDGHLVVFHSDAANLVPDDSNGRSDVFIRDLVKGTTSRINLTSSGAQASDGDSWGASISADDRYVAFVSSATNLVSDDTNGVSDVFVRDLVTGTTERVSIASQGTEADASSGPCVISGDGRVVAFVSHASNLGGTASVGELNLFVRRRW